jgi:hypothetical protein
MSDFLTQQSLVDTITEGFAENDQVYIEGQVKWAKERHDALIDLPKTDEYIQAGVITENDIKNASKWYRASSFAWERQRNLTIKTAGGKTWYDKVFYGRNWAMIEPMVLKNAKNVINKRNNRIATRLVNAEVTEITSSDYSSSFDGFHGNYVLTTNKGQKNLEIETILAGGFNIQCLHQRTLIKMDDCKKMNPYG